MQNDLTFFTNEPGSALLDRFKRTLRGVKFFDILVGYFRTDPNSPAASCLESEIDKLIDEPYGLTEEEIGIVEGKKK